MAYSSPRSLSLARCVAGLVAGLIADDGNEQIRDSGRAHLAKSGQLLMIDTIEQHDVATKHLALVHRLEPPCSGDLLGTHRDFKIARLQFFNAATEYDAA